MPQNCCEPPSSTTNVYNYTIPAAQFVQPEILSVIGGVNITLANTPISDSTVMIWKNGIYLTQGIDYTIVADAVTLVEATEATDAYVAFYIKA